MRDPTQRFGDRVADYTRYRPSYPAAVVETLEAEGLLGPGSRVADVGSGTGLLSEVFLARGHRVVGVEPNAAMREEGERRLRDRPGFTSVAGRAEATTLDAASVDLVAAGQAFHWFDPRRARREFSRILRPGGGVALVWNERHAGASAFMRGYESLLETHGTDYERVSHEPDPRVLAGFFGHARYETRWLDHSQTLDGAGLEGRVLSSSYVPARGRPGHEAVVRACGELFAAHQAGGHVVLIYRTRVVFGRPG